MDLPHLTLTKDDLLRLIPKFRNISVATPDALANFLEATFGPIVNHPVYQALVKTLNEQKPEAQDITASPSLRKNLEATLNKILLANTNVTVLNDGAHSRTGRIEICNDSGSLMIFNNCSCGSKQVYSTAELRVDNPIIMEFLAAQNKKVSAKDYISGLVDSVETLFSQCRSSYNSPESKKRIAHRFLDHFFGSKVPASFRKKADKVTSDASFDELVDAVKSSELKDYEKVAKAVRSVKDKGVIDHKVLPYYYTALAGELFNELDVKLGFYDIPQLYDNDKTTPLQFEKYLKEVVRDINKIYFGLRQSEFCTGDTVILQEGHFNGHRGCQCYACQNAHRTLPSEIEKVKRVNGKTAYVLSGGDGHYFGDQLKLVSRGKISKVKKKFGGGDDVAEKLVRAAVKKVESKVRKWPFYELVSKGSLKYEDRSNNYCKSIPTKKFSLSEWVNLAVSEEDHSENTAFARKIADKFQQIPGSADTRAKAEYLVNQAVEESRKISIEVLARSIIRDDLIKELQKFGVLGDNHQINGEVIKQLSDEKKTATQVRVGEVMREKGVNKDKISQGRYVYTTSGSSSVAGRILDPYAISVGFLNDLLIAVPRYAKNDRHRAVIEIAKEVIQGGKVPSRKEFMGALSKDNKAFFSSIEAVVGGDTRVDGGACREFNVWDTAEKRSDAKSGKLKEPDAPEGKGIYLAFRDVIVSELLGVLQAGRKDVEKQYADFEMVWRRFRPQEYDLQRVAARNPQFKEITLKPNYSFHLKKDGKVLLTAVEKSGACLTQKTVDAFTEDNGTIHLIEYRGEQPTGYARLFFMTSDKGETALALDTLEMDRKQFGLVQDSVRAMGLAIVQLGLDANIKYVVGEEGRVAFGLRQAFGNKRMKIKLNKMGLTEDLLPYSFKFDYVTGHCECEPFVLMQNWRV